MVVVLAVSRLLFLPSSHYSVFLMRLQLNAYVFPQVLEGAPHERDIRKRVSGENSNIQDRVIKICEDVQMEYNSKLLNWNPVPAITKKDIKKMSKEEMAALLMEMMEK